MRNTNFFASRAAVIFIGIVTTLLTSCEYEAYKRNFVEIDPPSADGIKVVILTSLTDSIRVFSDTQCNFNIQDVPANDGRVVIKLQNRVWNINSLSGSFIIHADSFPDCLDTIAMDVYIHSGTGSVADYLGAEAFYLHKSWTVLIDDRPPPRIVPVQSTDKSGFLKVTWPRCSQYNFKSYHMRAMLNGKEYNRDIFDQDSCSYVDTTYIGGQAVYSLKTYVYGYSAGGVDGSLILNEETPFPQFETIGLDSLRIFWRKSKYKCKYWLMLPPEIVIFQSFSDTTITIANPGFGKSTSYILTTSPYYITDTSDWSCHSQNKSYVLGDRTVVNWPWYAYNRIDKTIYTNSYNYMEGYDVYSMQKKQSITLDMLIYTGLFSCTTNTSEVAAITSKNVYVFNDQSLSTPVVIPYECWGKTIDHFSLTDNGLITIGRSSMFELINVDSGKVVASGAIDHYPIYNKSKSFATSNDGQYAGSVSHLGMSLFKIEADTLIKIHSDNRAYTSVLFDGKNTDYLLLKLKNNDTLEIRKASDFSLVRSVSLFPSILCNIDPENGLLVISDLEWLYILNPDTFETKFKVRCPSSEVSMFAGRLFSHSGYTLNISQFL